MKLIANISMALIAVLSGLFITIRLPQMKDYYLRWSVGGSVVKVVKLDPQGHILGGGTGFSIKGPSGKKYIITNAHVCEMYKGASEADVQEPDDTIKTRKIVEISQDTDLCLIEGINELSPISLASSVSIGENAAIIGHPELMPLTIAYGDIVEDKLYQVPMGIIGMDMPEEQCKLPKNRIIDVETFLGPLSVCVEEVEAYRITATSLPGNSGSPVVNYRGQLIGVDFAGDNDIHWGLVIPLDDVKDFLKGH